MAAIREIESSRWFERSERVDRLIEEADSIENWTNDRRIDIAAKLERLNLLAHIVSRTRKRRSEEHTSELQSLMRISYAVFCLKNNTTNSKQPSYITAY